MLAGPGDDRTVAARSRLRASHTERERTVDALKAAYVPREVSPQAADLSHLAAQCR